MEQNGASVEVPLIEEGLSIPVTTDTVRRYIREVANFKLNTQIARQCRAFCAGFGLLIDRDWLRMFGPSEFQMLISGTDSALDWADFWRHARVEPPAARSSSTLQHLKDVLQGFTVAQTALFLLFVTGCVL